MEIETSSKIQVEAEARIAKDFGDMCKDLGKKTKLYDALRAKTGKLEETLTALCNASNASEEKKEVLQSRVPSNAKRYCSNGDACERSSFA